MTARFTAPLPLGDWIVAREDTALDSLISRHFGRFGA